MKLRLYFREFYHATKILSQLSIEPESSDLMSQIRLQALYELKQVFMKVCANYTLKQPDKWITKEIPDSYALVFYVTFSGPGSGYDSVVTKEICSQIEFQLIRKGPFKLPSTR